jgi:hypothetical protein
MMIERVEALNHLLLRDLTQQLPTQTGAQPLKRSKTLLVLAVPSAIKFEQFYEQQLKQH